MISRRQSWTVSLAVVAFLVLGLLGCGGADSTDAACAVVPGQVTTSTGGSSINTYTLSLGVGSVRFSNDNSTFFTTVANQVVDVGPACLDTVTAWPGGGGTGPLTVIVGDAYVARFPVTTIVGGVETTVVSHAKFVVKSLSGGVVTVVYVPTL